MYLVKSSPAHIPDYTLRSKRITRFRLNNLSLTLLVITTAQIQEDKLKNFN